MQTLQGALVRLRPATQDDVPALSRIRATPEVYERWGPGDVLDADTPTLVILAEERVVGSRGRQPRRDPLLHQGRLPPGRHHAPL
ncbi:hypothetical protein [Actinoplanes sp. NPDC048796]|uniref:hypothetical protein n=1 Tax=Actinoplanes sp. NPDC048796 TaxID=3155640 RepID=UPI0033C41855